MIRLENVEKVYRTDRIETLAVGRVSLEVRRGEMVSVMGPSGSGKSTLLHLMGLLDSPSAGRIAIGGQDVSGLGDSALARLRNTTIGFVFQSFHLVPDLSVLENVGIPLLYRSIGGRERRRRAVEVLEKVGLGARMHHRPGMLSGGQQQRAAIARAIAGEPELLLADEPTGNLDSVMGQEIMGILLELNRGGTTVVMVTHDERMAQQTRRCIRLHDGRLVHEGAAR
jgi:putative ABC transport system ATP-binding protein